MGRVFTNTQAVIDTTLEHVRALDAQRDLWSSSEGRNLPARVAKYAVPIVSRSKARETEEVLRALITKLNENLDNARYLLMEIGSEMVGIQAEAGLGRSGVTLHT